MSLLKNWKLILAAMTVAMFTACAGSSGGSSDNYDSDETSYSEGDGGQKAAPKEKIDENKLKKTQEEAVAINEENHKLRKEIFEAKNKLGISTASEAAE